MFTNDKDYKWVYFSDSSSEEWFARTKKGEVLRISERDYIVTTELAEKTEIEDWDCTTNIVPMNILE